MPLKVEDHRFFQKLIGPMLSEFTTRIFITLKGNTSLMKNT
jgi:hypothetical protein